MDCLFCKIAKGLLPTKILYEDDVVLAFNDINPQAPHHVLIIPKKHIATLNDLDESDCQLIGRMMLIAKKIATDLSVAQPGFRVVMNCNADAGQTVFHIHLHLLAGRKLQWPPG